MLRFSYIIAVVKMMLHASCLQSARLGELDEWFSNLGLDSRLKGNYVDLSRLDLQTEGAADDPPRGFLATDDRGEPIIFSTSLVVHRLGGFNAFLSSKAGNRDLIQAADDLGQDDDERERAVELFVLSQAARVSHQDDIAAELLEKSNGASLWKSKEDYFAFLKKSIGERIRKSIYVDFTDPAISRGLLRERLARYNGEFKESEFHEIVEDQLKRLDYMIREDHDGDITDLEPAEGPTEKRVRRLIFMLRDQVVGDPWKHEYGFPEGDNENRSGMKLDLSTVFSGPAEELQLMGLEAAPSLMAHLGDRRLSRILSGDPAHPILVVGDVCERILERIAGQVFVNHQISLTPCQDSKLLHLAIDRAGAWYSSESKRRKIGSRLGVGTEFAK